MNNLEEEVDPEQRRDVEDALAATRLGLGLDGRPFDGRPVQIDAQFGLVHSRTCRTTTSSRRTSTGQRWRRRRSRTFASEMVPIESMNSIDLLLNWVEWMKWKLTWVLWRERGRDRWGRPTTSSSSCGSSSRSPSASFSVKCPAARLATIAN